MLNKEILLNMLIENLHSGKVKQGKRTRISRLTLNLIITFYRDEILDLHFNQKLKKALIVTYLEFSLKRDTGKPFSFVSNRFISRFLDDLIKQEEGIKKDDNTYFEKQKTEFVPKSISTDKLETPILSIPKTVEKNKKITKQKLAVRKSELIEKSNEISYKFFIDDHFDSFFKYTSLRKSNGNDKELIDLIIDFSVYKLMYDNEGGRGAVNEIHNEILRSPYLYKGKINYGVVQSCLMKIEVQGINFTNYKEKYKPEDPLVGFLALVSPDPKKDFTIFKTDIDQIIKSYK